MHHSALDSGHVFEVTPDLACLPQSIVNLFLFGRAGAPDRGWVLIDCGLPLSTHQLVRAAAGRYGPKSRPAAIILTHGHFDHAGDLPKLAETWDVPVYAHPLELPYLTGKSKYPPPDPAVGGGAMSFLARLYPRGPIDLGPRVHTLPADGTVPLMPGWRWLHTPGHTAGHVSLYREADRLLVAGDAFVTQRQESAWCVLTRRQEVRRPPAYYTTDWEAARQSVERLAHLQPNIAATGHGVPMGGEALNRQLGDLVRRWQEVAVPPQGRYVGRPAITDERGVVSVPPAVPDPQLLPVAGAALAAVAGVLLARSGSKS